MVRAPEPAAAHTAAFTIKHTHPAHPLGRPRVIVSTKVTKRATQRNLIKRRLRELWRELGKDHQSPHIYVKKAALAMSFAELRAEMAQALKRL
ncbi:hypothetical protein A2V68_00670 [candidate division Kazan bacterium RBG_13_50_9]|uniref:Uncharacterized protein n=1 Tax=candidate division Kazan bacterium RBG_13_50_9 TaxID=1798535 RepID=A0A1F4NS05_UNCK3|nr:MAG: hypothetical protein A2V68_00670 [candidate division Kazan bacterium RBG_13_50_9]